MAKETKEAEVKSKSGYEVTDSVRRQGYYAKIGDEQVKINKGQETVEVKTDRVFYELANAGVIVVPESEYERYKKLIGAKL